MRILITGGTGYIGSHLARRAASEGHDVHVLARSVEKAEPLRTLGITVHQGNLGDMASLIAAADSAEVIVHAAAVCSHRAAEDALKWTHVAGTENILNTARHVGSRRLVMISCADVSLTNQDRVHWNEAKPLTELPVDAHARTKQLGEDIAIATSDDELEVTALRPSFVWGPDDPHHLPRWCAEGMRGGIRLVGRGKNLLSTTHIENLIDATMLALTAEKAAHRAYYIADEDFLEAREFFGALSEALGLKAPRAGLPFGVQWQFARAREWLGFEGMWRSDVLHRGRSTSFDLQRAITDLGWRARISVPEGLKALKTWADSTGGAAQIAARVRPWATEACIDDMREAHRRAHGGDSATV